MKRLLRTAATLIVLLPLLGVPICPAQSMDDLNLQLHGYATQGFIYSTSNNWNTTSSTDGSAAWTEAVVNVTAQPQPKLRIGVQARYSLLGNYGNDITLDWAQADYKFNEKLGIRAGKVKTPAGLLNESQDIDPAHLWILLPQAVYNVASRNSVLSHYGGVVYGSVALGERLGKLDYRGFGGQRVVGADDGYLQPFRDVGMALPQGLTGPVYGATLMWRTPLAGLMAGATQSFENPSGVLTATLQDPSSGAAFAIQGNLNLPRLRPYLFFARYERKRVMLAGEYSRVATTSNLHFDEIPDFYIATDRREFYAMGTYKLAEKLTAGAYYSSILDRRADFTSDRYQKDWVLSARYDFNPYLYLKAEQHILDGTELGYSALNNAAGLKPDSRMTLLKVGVSF